MFVATLIDGAGLQPNTSQAGELIFAEIQSLVGFGAGVVEFLHRQLDVFEIRPLPIDTDKAVSLDDAGDRLEEDGRTERDVTTALG